MTTIKKCLSKQKQLNKEVEQWLKENFYFEYQEIQNMQTFDELDDAMWPLFRKIRDALDEELDYKDLKPDYFSDEYLQMRHQQLHTHHIFLSVSYEWIREQTKKIKNLPRKD